MARPRKAPLDLAGLSAERERLRAALAQVEAAEAEALLAQRDAGRPILIAALDRVKIPAMTKTQAKTIAVALSQPDISALLNFLELDRSAADHPS